jgi:protein-S-isoprenylcysteine O-methyltransferase Ste14
MRSLELKIPPVVVVLIAAGLMWVISAVAPSLRFSFPGRPLLALILVIAGVLVNASGITLFRRAQTTVNPMKPDSASSLVVDGIYRVTRNPMYLGFLLLLLGWAVFLSNMASLPVIPVFVAYMTCFQIVPEERALEAVFKQEYSAYKSNVRRWI